MLLVAIFFLALLVLSLSIAVPEITKQIRRDREMETMHRGKQYIRALQLYYRKFNAYPPNIGALVNTNNIKYLRKRYTDPLTGKDDWKPITFGQNKLPIALGFFGMPLTGGTSGVGGIGPGGVGAPVGVPGAGNTGSNGFGSSSFGSGAGFGSSGFGATGLGGANGIAPGAGQSPANGGTPGAAGGTGGTDPNNGGSSGTSAGGSTSSGLSSLSGQTFGGGGIIGFAPGRSGSSILLYKKTSEYNNWEFTYSPLMEIKVSGGGGSGFPGQPTGINPTGSGFGAPGSGFGASTGFGGANSGGTPPGVSGFGGSNSGTGSTPGNPPSQ